MGACCFQEKDPFAEDLNQEVKIGDVRVFLQPIAYMVEMKEQLEIVDLKGNKIGVMNVSDVHKTETRLAS